MALESQHRLNCLLPYDSTGTIWLAQRYSLNLNCSFLNRITLRLISSSYSVGLTKLSGLRSRPKVRIKITDSAGNRTRATGMEGRYSAITPQRWTTNKLLYTLKGKEKKSDKYVLCYEYMPLFFFHQLILCIYIPDKQI